LLPADTSQTTAACARRWRDQSDRCAALEAATTCDPRTLPQARLEPTISAT